MGRKAPRKATVPKKDKPASFWGEEHVLEKLSNRKRAPLNRDKETNWNLKKKAKLTVLSICLWLKLMYPNGTLVNGTKD